MAGGVVHFEQLFSLPSIARIPNLIKVYGFEKTHDVIICLLTSFNNSLNLIRPMSSEQIVECAYDLLLTTEEDWLSVEDLVIFFKGAKEGRYGKILDRLDHQAVFAMLEEYRQQRYVMILQYRERQHVQNKAQGPADRVTGENEIARSFCNIAGRLGDMKDLLKEQREINRANQL